MGVPEREAILAATANPARSIGIYDEVGSLAPGKRADIVLTDEELNIVKVLSCKRKAFRQNVHR